MLSEFVCCRYSYWFGFLLICFFIGVCAKSAQLGLHVWLPDAMEGPTPVSALLHAATMVTIGVFFLLRFSLLFSLVSEVLLLCLFIGGLTFIFSGIVGLFQYDLKRIIAFSTCSQLGIMIVGCSMLLVSGAFFHLFVHAFFKALLFLGCGVVIHFFMEEQDLRFMGASVLFVGPIYVCFFFGILALVGFPFLSGFYSKDFLIESSFFFFFFDGLFIGFLLCLGSSLTLFYSLRLIRYCFLGFPNSQWKVYFNLHFEVDVMVLVCILLGILSCIIGFLFSDIFLGFGGLVFFYSFVSVDFYGFIYDEVLISWF